MRFNLELHLNYWVSNVIYYFYYYYYGFYGFGFKYFSHKKKKKNENIMWENWIVWFGYAFESSNKLKLERICETKVQSIKSPLTKKNIFSFLKNTFRKLL